MRVIVLNGVNLDVLGRRDPALYGGLSLDELETRIYAWAAELGCRPLPPDEHEGEYVELVPRRARQGGRRRRQSRGVDALQLGDPRRARAVRESRSSRCISRTSTSARSGGGFSVISDLAAKRIVGKGPDGYREALEFLVATETRVNRARRAAARAARGAAPRHEPGQRPLPAGLRELERRAARRAGPRAALHRLPLRRAPRARSRASSSRRPRATCSAISPSALGPRRLRGRRRLTYAGYADARAGGLELVPRSGLVEALRAVKDEGELEAIRRACAITDRAFERLAEERFVGRPERELAWTLEQLFHEEGGDGLAFEADRRGRAEPARAARAAGRPGDRDAARRSSSTPGCTVDGYARTARERSRPGCSTTSWSRPTTSCSRRSKRRSPASGRGSRRRRRTRSARDVVDGTRFGGQFGHGLGHGLGLEVHEAPRLSPSRQTRSRRATSSRSSPASTSPAAAGSASRTSSIVTDDGSRCSPRSART